jgi:hypothetical protein
MFKITYIMIFLAKKDPFVDRGHLTKKLCPCQKHDHAKHLRVTEYVRLSELKTEKRQTATRAGPR